MDRKEHKPLRRAVIKEELYDLTGQDELSAVILNQLIYWSQRVRDYDKMLEEEYKRLEIEEGELNLTNGWIYKSRDELKEEVMTSASITTIGRRLDKLAKAGWVHKRKNPDNKRDRTSQYRVDLIAIEKDLFKLGYTLDNYPILSSKIRRVFEENNHKPLTAPIVHDEHCNVHGERCKVHSERTLPKSTTEIIINNNNNKEENFGKIQTEPKKPLIIEEFKKAFGEYPNAIQLEILQKYSLSKKIILAVIRWTGRGMHNASFMFNQLDQLQKEGISSVKEFKKSKYRTSSRNKVKIGDNQLDSIDKEFGDEVDAGDINIQKLEGIDPIFKDKGLKNNANDFWKEVLKETGKRAVTTNTLEQFDNISLEVVDNQNLVVITPNSFVKDWVEGKFLGLIHSIIYSLTEKRYNIEVEIITNHSLAN